MSNLIKPTLKNRLLNALAALRGRSTRDFESAFDRHAFKVNVDLDTTQFEEDLERLKIRVGELNKLVAAAGHPEPRLMIKSVRPLSHERQRRLDDSFRLALASDKPLVIDDGMEVFQLVDGRWQALESFSSGADPEDESKSRSHELSPHASSQG